MSVLTQGTQLYVIDPDDNSVITVGCVTSINGLSAPRDQIEDTCLSATARTFKGGLANPGAMTFGLNFDPSDTSHVRLHELYVANENLNFAIGWADGTAAPAEGTNGEWDTMPTTRTYITFDGFISDLSFDFSLNAVVTSSVSVQMSGLPVLSD